MKKRILSFVVAGAMAMSLAACGGSGTPAATQAASQAATQAAAESKAEDNKGGADPAQVELNLIIASNQTSEENPYSIGMDAFKDALEEVSGGKATATVHKGTLGENENELVEKLSMGAADLVVASPGFMTSIGVPEVDFFSLYYIFDSFDHWEAALDGDFGAKMQQTILDKTNNGFRVMSYWTSSVRDYYGKKAIKTPADLKGMTIRTQSSQVQQEFWKQCGAVPTSVAWGELYQALQQGVVDSAENDYTSFMLKEHHKTPNGHYICETHHDFTTRLLLMDGNRYNKLTDEQKEWVDAACKKATEVERETVYTMFKTSKEKVIADGAEVTAFEDMDIDAFKKIAEPIQEKFAKDNGMEEELEMVKKANPANK